MDLRAVSFWLICGLVVGAAPLAAQRPTVDPALAKQGENVFVQRGCQGCHTIGKGKGAGPDLAGVFDRRSVDWVKRWIKAPDQMLASDSLAQTLLEQNNNTVMPNLKLNDKEVDALLHYIAQQDAKVHGS